MAIAAQPHHRGIDAGLDAGHTGTTQRPHAGASAVRRSRSHVPSRAREVLGEGVVAPQVGAADPAPGPNVIDPHHAVSTGRQVRDHGGLAGGTSEVDAAKRWKDAARRYGFTTPPCRARTSWELQDRGSHRDVRTFIDKSLGSVPPYGLAMEFKSQGRLPRRAPRSTSCSRASLTNPAYLTPLDVDGLASATSREMLRTGIAAAIAKPDPHAAGARGRPRGALSFRKAGVGLEPTSLREGAFETPSLPFLHPAFARHIRIARAAMSCDRSASDCGAE